MTDELDKAEIIGLLFPAVNVLRSIELNLQEHKCVYQDRVSEATLNLCKLMDLVSRRMK